MSSKSKSTSSLDPKYGSLVYDNAARANNLADSFQPYTGQRVAGFNEAQTQAQQQYRDFAGGNVGGGLLDQATGAASGAAGYQPLSVANQQVTAGQLAGTDLSAYQNPYDQQVIDSFSSDANRQRDIALSQGRAQALKAGAWGGSGGAIQQGQISDNYDRGILSNLASLRQTGFNNAQDAARFDIGNRLNADQFNANGSLTAQQSNQGAGLTSNAQRLQASGILSGLSDQQRAQALQSIGLTSAVGDINQQQEQAQLDGPHNAYLEWLQTQMQGQNIANSGVGLVPQTGTTTVKQSPGLTGILSAAGSAAQGAAAIFSDAALKTDIQPIGQDHRGRNWYSYRYVWEQEGAVNHGVMAQEVQKTDPHAVFLHPSGFLMVDYGALD